MVLLSMRARKFYQRTGRKIIIDRNSTAGYDKSKVECFNCHKMGHFARERRAPRSKDNRNWNQGSSSKAVRIEDAFEKAMCAIDGAGFDWSDMAEEEIQANMALMAFSDSEVTNDKSCSKSCLQNYESLKKQYDDLLVKLDDTGRQLFRWYSPGAKKHNGGEYHLLRLSLRAGVLDLENVKDAQALEIKKLKKRVKSGKEGISQEDSSKQERNEIDQDEGISWFQEDLETQGRYGHDIRVNTASTSITTTSINITTAKLVTIASAQTKSEKSKAKGVTMQEPSESGIRVRVPPPQINPKDKGKAKMVEPKNQRRRKIKLNMMLM
ncbi:ribonuclease H-like domain-containing protein [Tanacetum coccineum]